jgi:hypothetical protein
MQSALILDTPPLLTSMSRSDITAVGCLQLLAKLISRPDQDAVTPTETLDDLSIISIGYPQKDTREDLQRTRLHLRRH